MTMSGEEYSGTTMKYAGMVTVRKRGPKQMPKTSTGRNCTLSLMRIDDDDEFAAHWDSKQLPYWLPYRVLVMLVYHVRVGQHVHQRDNEYNLYRQGLLMTSGSS
jgi:hypothetical protein